MDIGPLQADEMAIADQFAMMTRLEQFLDFARCQVPHLTDAQLEQGIELSKTLQHKAFLLAGACVSELQKRHSLRLAGGRGQKDTEGIGLEATLRRASNTIGRDPETLRMDARIFDQFFSDMPEDVSYETTTPETTAEPTETAVATVEAASILPWEYYANAVALPVEMRQEAIELAHSRRDEPGYNATQHRLQCKALKKGSEPEEQEKIFYLTVPLLPADREAVRILGLEWGCDQQGVVLRAIREAKTGA